MPKAKDVHKLIGPTINQYGQFHLKQYDLYVDGRVIPMISYEVQLSNEDGSYETHGLIKKEVSTLPELLIILHDRQHEIYNLMHQAKQLHDRAKDDEAKARFQTGLDAWKPTYTRLVRAIRELEPEFQPDETITIHVPRDTGDENESTCNLD